MKSEEIRFTGNEFEWMGVRYDISLCVERDIELIKQEAERTHGGVLDVLYVLESLCPCRIRLYLDGNDKPLYMMVIYGIAYRNGNCFRSVCGDYYPIGDGTVVYPHPYQASIYVANFNSDKIAEDGYETEECAIEAALKYVLEILI